MDYTYLVNPNKLYLYTQTKIIIMIKLTDLLNEAKFDRNKLMRVMKKYDDAMIMTSDGKHFVIYSPYSNNKDNADMWNRTSVFALDQDGEEHEVDYKDIVSVKG